MRKLTVEELEKEKEKIRIDIDELEDQIKDWKEDGAEEHSWLPEMEVKERWEYIWDIEEELEYRKRIDIG